MEKFTITDKGYSVPEVNKFIDNVISHTESMLDKMKKQQKEIEIMKKELDNYKKVEQELKGALFKAEQSSTDIKKQAYDEKNVIIEEARRNASRIVNEALLRAEKIELRADTLERNMRIFKKKLKLVVEQQLSVIDEIEELELK
ncbi:MAG: DivIVA domain-containing protein [Bacilli bacterium]|nr:DivIVA domain-containing protein [Bacilli bacterium]